MTIEVYDHTDPGDIAHELKNGYSVQVSDISLGNLVLIFQNISERLGANNRLKFTGTDDDSCRVFIEFEYEVE